MREAGLPVRADLEGDWSPARGYLAGRELARHRQFSDFSAVFVANDQMAIGVLHAFAQAGIDVPGEGSLIRFDDGPRAGVVQPAPGPGPAGFHRRGAAAGQTPP